MIWSRSVMEVIVEYTTNYRVASIIKLNGFGVSVIQRLCKTSVKKNLYWEVKDKVIEEAYNGVRTVKKSQKVKVYGVDSTREVRARLIEILYDRVALHKDKFVAPILHQEMQSMEVKKNGKVEHSDNSHDDQVFSYLMALYTWYDGKNLAENFHIMKNTIKTDQDEELEELDIEDSIEKTEKIDLESTVYEPDSQIAKDYEFILSNSVLITSKDLNAETYLKEVQQRNLILASNKNARESFCAKTGVNPKMYMNETASTYVSLPDTLFMDSDDFMFDDEENNRNTVLAGNLASLWDKI